MASTMTIEVCHGGLVLDCTIYTWPATRGARDSFNGRAGAGIQLEPDEPAGFSVENVTMLINEDDLSSEEIAEVLADDDGICSAVERELENWEPDYEAA